MPTPDKILAPSAPVTRAEPSASAETPRLGLPTSRNSAAPVSSQNPEAGSASGGEGRRASADRIGVHLRSISANEVGGRVVSADQQGTESDSPVVVRVRGPRVGAVCDETLSLPSPSEVVATDVPAPAIAENPPRGDGENRQLTGADIQAGVLSALDPVFVAEHLIASEAGGVVVTPSGSAVTSYRSGRNPDVGIGRRYRSPSSQNTLYSKRFKSLRPVGTHPALERWDVLPFQVRSSLAGQERRIFSVSGFLVSRLDLQYFQLLREHQPHRLHQVFPKAPSWWPRDWGHLPIMLPWEIGIRKAELCAASDKNAPVWQEVYQRFLQQLAAGWDLEWEDSQGRSSNLHLPAALAKEMLAAGALAFLSRSSIAFRDFLSFHGIPENQCPLQSPARDGKWDSIRLAYEIERQKVARVPTVNPVQDLGAIVRAAGLDSLAFESMGRSVRLNLSRPSVLCALAAAALRTARKMERVRKGGVDGRRDGDQGVSSSRIPGWDSLPSLAENLKRWFDKYLEDIQDLAEV